MSRVNFHFALGKAREDARRLRDVLRELFEGQCPVPGQQSLRRGPQLRARQALKEILTRDFFEEREEWGCQAPDPIFIVEHAARGVDIARTDPLQPLGGGGNQRAARVLTLARELREESECRGDHRVRAGAGEEERQELRLLGEHYMERTRIQRKTGRPFFIDKMPNNFLHVAMIHARAAERKDHRRATASTRLLLLELQAALRARPALQLRPRRHGSFLPGLRRN